MSESKQYEMASAYVSVIPSLQGMREELRSQLNSSMPNFKKTLDRGFKNAFAGSMGGMKSVLSANNSAFSAVGQTVGKSLTSAVRGSSAVFKDTMTTGAKAAGAALAGSVAAVGSQIAFGGFSRALGINEAEAKLKALGYQGEQFSAIMGSASDSIDGSRFTLDESIGAASQLLASGIKPGEELTGILENIGKLTDMSGTRSYADMSSIFSKNAASGIVQMEDLNQLIDAGIAILPSLADKFGVTTQEVKKMASAGKISFADFNSAISDINFDSEMFAELNVTAAFNNVRSQLSKIGATLWTPIIDGLGPVLGNVRGALMALQKNSGFNDFINLVQTTLASFMENVEGLSSNLSDVFSNADQVSGFIDNIKSRFEDFKTAISGLEGPLVGLGVALGSGVLSKLPIVGGMFGKISIGSGLLGGALVQIFSSSEMLQTSIGGLIESFKGMFSGIEGPGNGALTAIGDSMSLVVDAISSAISDIDLGSSGIDLSGMLTGLLSGITDFIKVIVDNKDLIFDAISGVGETIQTAFSSIASFGGDASLGETIGETLIFAIEAIAAAINVAVPIISGAIGALGAIATSDFAAGALGVLVDLGNFLAEHEGVMIALGGTLTALFVGGKLVGGLSAISGFFGKASSMSFDSGGLVKTGEAISGGISGFFNVIKGAIESIGGTFSTIFNQAGEIVKSIGGFLGDLVAALGPVVESVGGLIETILIAVGGIFETFVSVIGKIGLAVLKAMPGLAVLGALLLALGALGWALNAMGFFEVLEKTISIIITTLESLATLLGTVAAEILTVIQLVFETIASGLRAGWSVLEPILSWLRDSWLLIFETISTLVLDFLPVIVGAVTEFMTTSAEVFSTMTASIGGLLTSLADNGVAAGAGGLAAAGGITALAGALLLLSGANAVGGVVESVGNSITGFIDALSGNSGENGGLGEMIRMAATITEFDKSISGMPQRWAEVANKAYSSGGTVIEQFGKGLTDGFISIESVISGRLEEMLNNLQRQIDSKPLNVNVNTPANYSGGSFAGVSNTTNNNYNLSTRNDSTVKTLLKQRR